MAERNRRHILLKRGAHVEPYQRPLRRIPEGKLPTINRSEHGRNLQVQLEAAAEEGQSRRAEPIVNIAGSQRGIRVVFDSFPGIELAFESLDPTRGRSHPELLSVREVMVGDKVVEQATVFIPEGKLGYFLGRIGRYIETAEADKTRHRELIDRIQSIGLASLPQLWTDDPSEFPTGGATVWWEAWLRRRDGEVDRLRSYASAIGAQMSKRILVFRDRVVVLVRASPEQLASAIDVLDDLAELRKPRQPAEPLASEPPLEQAEWAENLAARTHPAPPGSPAACVVDTGVFFPHPLLKDSLLAEDCHVADPAWNALDHDGHGTAMAGLALYGDFGDAVLSDSQIHLRHRLESLKLLPPFGENPPDLWGAITAAGVSRVEIQAPERPRVLAMPITAPLQSAEQQQVSRITTGEPSSWSAAVDALAAGLGIEVTDDGLVFLGAADEDAHRLFLLAAGNIRTWEDGYLDRCDAEPIEDPGQAWNALTVGAYTDMVAIAPDEVEYDGWTALATRGELSPLSRTSVAFEASWPMKPDIVLEGGNVARSPSGTEFHTPNSFQRLTTNAPLHNQRLFTVTNATSAATANAAHLAASILADYPGLWPETVRALVIHSAEWSPAMRLQFAQVQTRKAKVALRRRYGMGVPNLSRATRSASDALTLVVEDRIRPFDKQGRMLEMHLHDLPWPAEILADLGGAPVSLRITLSYYIEPNPGKRGWVRRYSYPSHGLRFDVRRATESTDEFRKRINKLALAEAEKRPSGNSDSQEWYFGPDYRVAGSVHTDIWNGTAAELAQRGAVAIYPVAGWWKEQPHPDGAERPVRYALIVSIATPDLDVDIWTPVAQQVGIPVEVET